MTIAHENAFMHLCNHVFFAGLKYSPILHKTCHQYIYGLCKVHIDIQLHSKNGLGSVFLL